jgi:hypothetical protein
MDLKHIFILHDQAEQGRSHTKPKGTRMPLYNCKHHLNGNCSGEFSINKEAEKNSRRNFLKLADTMGFGFGSAAQPWEP